MVVQSAKAPSIDGNKFLVAKPVVSRMGKDDKLEQLIDKNLIVDFFGQTKAEERQFAHIEEMIKTFVNPIEEMEEEKEEDTVQ